MAVKQEKLKELNSEMPFKWREQSVNNRGATMIAYIDARQLFDKLDDVCGVGNWQSDFRLVDNKLYGGIGILVEQESEDGQVPPQWVWKWDVGSESNVEKEKGETSDALKRAGVQFGVGRFLYSLGIVTLRSAEYNGKWKPADDSGNIIWDKDKLNELCHQSVNNGELDRTKLGYAPKPATKTTTSPKVPSTPTATKPKPWLNKSTPEFEKAKADIIAKTTTVLDLSTLYNMSGVVKKELESLGTK